jgi:phosphoribosylanthranilate isomerase
MKQPGDTTRVKFCGMRRVEDVQLAVDLGVDYLGFVLVPGTPRAVDAAQVLRIQQQVGCSRVCRVGVFRNQPADVINRLVERLCLDLVQLHGSEDVSVSGAIDVPVIRMLPVATGRTAASSDALPQAHLQAENLYAFLLDAMADGGASGGLGVRADPHRLAQAIATIPPSQRLILAGGLTPQNVRAIVDRYQPDVVDVSSGVESEPGIKDADRMRAFLQAVRMEQAE